MRTFLKAFSMGMVLTMALGLPGGAALAENSVAAQAPSGFSAKGSIAAPNGVYVFAPMGGQAEDFSWVAGDRAEAGALVFALRPAQVRAADDGVISGLRAKAGDQAAAIQAQYGALCYVEREDIWRVKASTSSAYDDPDNRDVRVGQTLRVQHGTGDSKVRGEGAVISVEGKEFVLEMERGDFEVEDSVKVYLETSKDNASKDQVGSGKVARADALPALGEGVVASVLVTEGQRVTRGQPLFILDSADARFDAAQQALPEVRFPKAGLIGEVLVRPGQFVYQNQAVMTLLPVDALEATLEVDELDIARVRVGDTVRVGIDAYGQERMGAVKEIRPIGQIVLDTTKFLVKVSLDKSDDLMIGMHVTGYWD